MSTKAGSPFTVLIHVTEPLLRAGIRASLANEPNIFVIDAEPSSINCAVDVLIVDNLTMAPFVEKAGRIRFGPNLELTRILVLTPYPCERTFQGTMKLAIHGCLLTSVSPHELVAGVRSVARGDVHICPQISGQWASRIGHEALTSREDEVLQLLAEGQCNKAIARNLDIAVGTVKTHVQSIMVKLNARTRTEATRVAVQRGMVEVQLPSYNRGLQMATRATAASALRRI